MTLSTSHASGDVIASADIDAIATQVNTNTDAIATNTTAITTNATAALQAANNLSDVADATTAVGNLGLTGAVVVATASVTSRLWIQGDDPDTTNPGEAADGDLWAQPVS